MMPEQFNTEVLTQLVSSRMPYGKYKGVLLCDLPEHFIIWYKTKGFPQGKLGMQLATLYEIKLNGLEFLLQKIKSFQ